MIGILFNFRMHKKNAISPTPLFLDVSGTKVRLNPVSSARITDFFRTAANG
ncbi:hypothetical protein [Flavobacterium fluvii]|uniref:hypothetical protein n=1 Tax=Flavobacterium fluvii TaxID=468056 RepID=UPI00147DA913|nr:hypothetical protein [Flavobacterium fluvii]